MVQAEIYFLLLPSLAVAARRLHDVGRSGWWILIAFTVIGIIPLLIWYVTDTKDEENIIAVTEYVDTFCSVIQK